MRRFLVLLVIAGWTLSALPASAATESVAPPFSDATGSTSVCTRVPTLVDSCAATFGATKAGSLDVSMRLTSPNGGALPGYGSAQSDATLATTHAVTGAKRVTYTVVYNVSGAGVTHTGSSVGSMLDYASVDLFFSVSPHWGFTGNTVEWQSIADGSGHTDAGTFQQKFVFSSQDGTPIDDDISISVTLRAISDLGGRYALPDTGTLTSRAHVDIVSFTAEVVR